MTADGFVLPVVLGGGEDGRGGSRGSGLLGKGGTLAIRLALPGFHCSARGPAIELGKVTQVRDGVKGVGMVGHFSNLRMIGEEVDRRCTGVRTALAPFVFLCKCFI